MNNSKVIKCKGRKEKKVLKGRKEIDKAKKRICWKSEILK